MMKYHLGQAPTTISFISVLTFSISYSSGIVFPDFAQSSALYSLTNRSVYLISHPQKDKMYKMRLRQSQQRCYKGGLSLSVLYFEEIKRRMRGRQVKFSNNMKGQQMLISYIFTGNLIGYLLMHNKIMPNLSIITYK